jgi:hypothetical protein
MIRSLCCVAMQSGTSERHSPCGASLESRRCYFSPEARQANSVIGVCHTIPHSLQGIVLDKA